MVLTYTISHLLVFPQHLRTHSCTRLQYQITGSHPRYSPSLHVLGQMKLSCSSFRGGKVCVPTSDSFKTVISLPSLPVCFSSSSTSVSLLPSPSSSCSSTVLSACERLGSVQLCCFSRLGFGLWLSCWCCSWSWLLKNLRMTCLGRPSWADSVWTASSSGLRPTSWMKLCRIPSASLDSLKPSPWTSSPSRTLLSASSSLAPGHFTVSFSFALLSLLSPWVPLIPPSPTFSSLTCSLPSVCVSHTLPVQAHSPPKLLLSPRPPSTQSLLSRLSLPLPCRRTLTWPQLPPASPSAGEAAHGCRADGWGGTSGCRGWCGWRWCCCGSGELRWYWWEKKGRFNYFVSGLV